MNFVFRDALIFKYVSSLLMNASDGYVQVAYVYVVVQPVNEEKSLSQKQHESVMEAHIIISRPAITLPMIPINGIKNYMMTIIIIIRLLIRHIIM